MNEKLISQKHFFQFPGDEEILLNLEKVESFTLEQRKQMLKQFLCKAEENAFQQLLLVLNQKKKINYQDVMKLDSLDKQIEFILQTL